VEQSVSKHRAKRSEKLGWSYRASTNPRFRHINIGQNIEIKGMGFEDNKKGMAKLISPTELANMLDISIETVYAWTSQKRIPYIKMGRLVRFDMEEVGRWIAGHKVAPYTDKERRCL
jgi:excisionase family DNA binding protein